MHVLQAIVLSTGLTYLAFVRASCEDTVEMAWFRLKKKGYKREGDVIKVVGVKDISECAIYCSSETKRVCKSFNIIEEKNGLNRGNCELISTSSTIENGETMPIFVSHDGAKHFEKVSLKLPPSCSALKKAKPQTTSSYQLIQPSEEREPFTVFCNMSDKNGAGVTAFGHDSESRTHVIGYEASGSYRKAVTYNSVTMEQIVSVINASKYCEQFIKWDCKHAGFFFATQTIPDSWWVSRQGYDMYNWGGAPSGSRKCACDLTKTCSVSDHRDKCNCDNYSFVWHEDSGYLVDKQYLPVTELRFGDTGEIGEEGYYTLGKLLCWD